MLKCLVAVAALLLVSTTTRAQINAFGGYRGPALTAADYTAGNEAAARLLDPKPKPVGSVESWSNDTAGNAGTLTIERAYRRRGHDCRAIRSRVTYKTGNERSVLLNACRVAGQWKLAN